MYEAYLSFLELLLEHLFDTFILLNLGKQLFKLLSCHIKLSRLCLSYNTTYQYWSRANT